jgi:DNA primase
MNNNVEQIKAKLDIVEVIRDYIAVKQAGTNFKAVCPFHNEKSPSLVISPAKQIWHCFGCGKGGDIFSFVMEKEGLDFPEALKSLAARAGVVLEQFNTKKNSEKQRLMSLMDLAVARYVQLLEKAKDAEPARKYLEERGLSEEVIEEWQIGYSSTAWDDLVKIAQAKGYTLKELVADRRTERASAWIIRHLQRSGFLAHQIVGERLDLPGHGIHRPLERLLLLLEFLHGVGNPR